MYSKKILNAYEELNEYEKFKNLYTVVLQKLLFEHHPVFTFLEREDKEPFDILITLNYEKEIFIKFRTNPTKTELERINKIDDNNFNFKRTELYIHQSDSYSKNLRLEKYKKKVDFSTEFSSKILIDFEDQYIFWGEEILNKIKKDFSVDYSIYYDDKIKLSHLDIEKYSDQLITTLQYNFHTTQRKYSFVLGAGVSVDYGIPMWNILLNKYMTEIKAVTPFNEDYIFEKIGDTSLIKAQFVVDNFSAASTQSSKEYEFCRDMKKMFYTKKPFIRLGNSTLKSVVKCIEKHLTTNSGVITYNYDDLIERTFDVETSINYQTIYKDDEIENKDVNIYHVHGYLPRKGNLKKEQSDSIVLSEQKYNYLFNNPLSWQISNQLTRFRENLCVLVGLSISDPSLRRLLENVKMSNSTRFHYAIMAKKSKTHIPTIKDIVAITKHFERIGIHIIWVENYSDIATIIDSL